MNSKILKITNNYIYNKDIDNLKIAVIGDIHFSKNVSCITIDFMLKQIKEGNPNYICIVGDIIDSPKYLTKEKNRITDFFESLSKIAPTVVIIGNHDIIEKQDKKLITYSKNIWNFLNEIPDLYFLDNKNIIFDNIIFTGIMPPIEYYCNNNKYKENLKILEKFFKNNQYLYKDIDKSKLNICLIHSPMFLNNNSIVNLLKSYDLLLSGHMHNGCLPILLDDIYKGNKGLISPDKKMFIKYSRGFFNIDNNSKMYITGGITKLSLSSKYFQLFNILCYQNLDFISISKEKQDKVVKRIIIK